jgi:RIO kinase 2
MKVYMKRGLLSKVGPKVGVGKESDIYLCGDQKGGQVILKLAR